MDCQILCGDTPSWIQFKGPRGVQLLLRLKPRQQISVHQMPMPRYLRPTSQQVDISSQLQILNTFETRHALG
jgi:hypothetical protein